MTTYQNIMIPYWLRIDHTQTKEVNEKSEGRRESEWGNIKHRPDETYHLLSAEERKRNRDDD